MRNKTGTAFMLLGAVLLLAALSLFFWNWREDVQAGEASDQVLLRLKGQLEEREAPDGPSAPPQPVRPDPYDPAMTEVEIDGYAYIGYLSIPSVGIELPVMSEWDYTRLKIAPCRYVGSTKTGDLVIAAHNNSRHFGPIKDLALSIGDAVYFTDMDGVVTCYQVAEVYILQPTAVEEMTSSGYPLTLFTCTYGGRTRVTVRCERVE